LPQILHDPTTKAGILSSVQVSTEQTKLSRSGTIAGPMLRG
jgi:hypothetical protein